MRADLTDFSPGGSYTWRFAAMTGLAGTDWDLLRLTTASVSATTLAKFTIQIESLIPIGPGAGGDLLPVPPPRFSIATSSAHSFTEAMLDSFALNTTDVQTQFPLPWHLDIGNTGGSIDVIYGPEPASALTLICAGMLSLKRPSRNYRPPRVL